MDNEFLVQKYTAAAFELKNHFLCSTWTIASFALVEISELPANCVNAIGEKNVSSTPLENYISYSTYFYYLFKGFWTLKIQNHSANNIRREKNKKKKRKKKRKNHPIIQFQ